MQRGEETSASFSGGAPQGPAAQLGSVYRTGLPTGAGPTILPPLKVKPPNLSFLNASPDKPKHSKSTSGQGPRASQRIIRQQPREDAVDASRPKMHERLPPLAATNRSLNSAEDIIGSARDEFLRNGRGLDESRQNLTNSAGTDNGEFEMFDLSKLPLEAFDNAEYETKSPEEWIEEGRAMGGTPAMSRFYNAAGQYEWAACDVVDYNAEEDTYLIRWRDGGRLKPVKRLNLVFDGEDPERWKRRRQEAQRLRKEASAAVRYGQYVEEQTKGETITMQKEQVSRILRLATTRLAPGAVAAASNGAARGPAAAGNAGQSPRNEDEEKSPEEAQVELVFQALLEVREGYTRAVKKSIVDERLRDSEDRARVAEMLRVSGLPIRDLAPAPEQGCVIVPERSLPYAEARAAVAGHLYASSVPKFLGFQALFVAAWREVQDHALIDTRLKGVPLPCSLEAYAEEQRHARKETALLLEEDWRQGIVNGIEDQLMESFEVFSNSVEDFRASRLARFLKYLSLLMTTSLRAIHEKSIADALAFYGQYDLAPAGPAAPAPGEAAEGEAAEPAPAAPAPAPAPAVAAVEEGGTVLTMGARTTERPPLFAVKLVAKEGGFEFEPSMGEVAETALALFDEMFTEPPRVREIRSEMVPLLEVHAGDLPTLPLSHPEVQAARAELARLLAANCAQPAALAALYEPFRYLLGVDPQGYAEEFAAREGVSLVDVRADVARLRADIARIEALTNNEVSFNMVLVQVEELKAELGARAEAMCQAHLRALEEQVRSRNREICDGFEAVLQRVQRESANVEELMEGRQFLQKAVAGLTSSEKEIRLVADKLRVLEEFCYSITDEDLDLNCTAVSWPEKIRAALSSNEYRLEEEKRRFSGDLKEEQERFSGELVQFSNEVAALANLDNVENVDDIAEQVFDLQKRLEQAQERAKLINSRETLFAWGLTEYPELATLTKDFEPYLTLWTAASEWSRANPVWFDGPFQDLDPEQMEKDVTGWWKTFYKLAKVFKDVPGPAGVANALKGKLDEFKVHLPLITALRNPGLRDRHWGKLSEALGFTIKPSADLTLAFLLERRVSERLEEINGISDVAAKEFSLEKALDTMLADWKEIVFESVAYRTTGTHVLKGVDDITLVLDDQIVKTQTMQGSPFIGPFRDRIVKWEATLKNMQEIIDEWLNCQKAWLYLEPIFGSEDIMRQMPTEGRRFAGVDQFWRKTMEMVVKTPSVLAVCAKEGLLTSFQKSNAELDQIQKGLNEYLETKRLAFPRFFFLSNDELLEILSQTKDPKAVQPHMPKCFEAITKLDFEPNLDITAMYSAEGEKVKFIRKIVPTANVEQWLLDVEGVMRASLRQVIVDSMADYNKTPREKWVLAWPGQVVLCVGQLYWTKEVHEAIRSGGVQGLRQYEQKLGQQLEAVTGLVRGDLTALNRITLGALVTIDVHARDVITELVQEQVGDENDFGWISQLRYYWENDNMYVKMISASLAYGYEYLGNSMRLVITPLTDRCYRTLMGALQLTLGGAPEGPAGTGKTETTKDLAKAIAKQCVVFNCSDGLDYLAMGKFFKGLASSGAWACFDEFNRIDVEVLSVIAQQILSIQRAIAASLQRFTFEGTEIALDRSCAVFITMNPGYAGRSDLPDNLKALFRPVAMMVPNYALISEISLYSYGFKDARNLARKIVATFKLSSEQLSSQDHYDFGMRAVKSVLTAAGRLKRDLALDTPEEIIILRALNDSNLPKFLSEDLPLFRGITSDLFPGVELPEPDYEKLYKAMDDAIASMNLQGVPMFKTKVIQLFETVMVRHGLMLVGAPYSGKSANYKVLTHAMSHIKDHPDFQKVRYHVINPKSITMGQLYGQFDPVSHEWTDGVLANTVRMCASDPSPDRKWVVFDGPVDAIWIENMNTVLDDNKKLCLNSGEIIKLSPPMTMMFEVEDLSVASPATVSRCGMVYMEPSQLGWRALLKSWLHKLPKTLSELHGDRIARLFDWMVDPCLKLVRYKLKEPVPTTDMALAAALMRLYQSLLDEFPEEEKDLRLSQKEQETLVDSAFVFALVWSVGCTSDTQGRAQFSDFLRTTVANGGPGGAKLALALPEQGLVHDYLYEKERAKWVDWMSSTPQYAIPAKARFTEITVPTADTIRYSYLLRLLVEHHVHVLFTGPTGTGKTIIVNDLLLNGLDKEKWNAVLMNFSAQTSANMTQDIIDSKLEKRRKGVFGPSFGKRIVIFVDDLNMPQREKYFAQPPIELLRQWMDHGGWYDRKTTEFTRIEDIQFVAAMGPPGGGRNPVTQRYLRHYNLVGFTVQNDESLGRIFSCIVDWYLADFPAQMRGLGRPIVDATIETYNEIARVLLPTPAKSHYTFNLRDLSKVFQGVLSAYAPKITSQDALIRLWAHELCRVFQDRLVDDADRGWFQGFLEQMCQKHFKLKWADVLPPGQALVFGDFMAAGAEGKQYVELTDMAAVTKVAEEYLEDYNAVSHKGAMHLVLFQFALDHLARISRIIKQPFGNALLVGVGGSGRQSLSRLAAHMADFKCVQIEISKGYDRNKWREDLRNVLRQAGTEEQQVVFLLSDTQIVEESMLEDMNNVLNTGEVPNLFPQDETTTIVEKMRPAATAAGRGANNSMIFQYFVERCRNNLHVVLCMSPIGDAFRNRLRMFPSLVNCCTIDWFSTWPESALRSVAAHAISQVDLDKGVLDGCVDVCMEMHVSVRLLSEKYKQELRRFYYVTPTSYLELLSTFKTLLAAKRDELSKARRRYLVGLEKLLTTASQVKEMQRELEALQPVLIRKTAETEELMKTITRDSAAAEQTKVVVEAEEREASKQAEAAAKMKAECEADLAEAMPALESALKALRTLNKNDITEVRSLKTPPAGVKLVLETLCIMLGVKPQKVGEVGSKVDDYWEPAKKELLGDSHFLDRLYEYDKDNIPEAVVAKIRPYIKNPEFDPAKIAKASKAATGLCLWVRAMETYDRVAKVVAPKKKALADAEAELAEVMQTLNAKKSELAAVVGRLAELTAAYEQSVREKQELAVQVDVCEKKLSRAQKLIGGLGGEKDRWTATAESLGQQYENLVGDVLLSSGIIAYLGVFTLTYRQSVVAEWVEALKARGIPCSPDFSLSRTLGEPVKIREWTICGLPSDRFSVDNGIIVSKSRRWPLLVDPQGQANKWIKNMEKANNLMVVKLSDSDFVRSLENAIQFGNPVLIENVGEELDPVLEPLLLKQTFKSGGRMVIRLGDTTVEYSPDFRLYITTKLRNPHYSPEICVKVCLVNFMITPEGLEDQMLGIVVAKERPDLEDEKAELIIQSAKNKKALKEIEDRILELLSSAQGNILDDETLINTLAQSKVTSEEIAKKVREAEVTERKIDEARSKYKPVAFRSSILFFAIADLCLIDPMYQYSLSWYINLYLFAIADCPRSEQLEKRLADLNEAFTYVLYRNVCRSLFEKHKLLFSFLLCIKILQSESKLDPALFRFLLTGFAPVAHDGHGAHAPPPNPAPAWLPELAWTRLLQLSTIPPFHGLEKELPGHIAQWKALFDSTEPHEAHFPAPYGDLDPLQRMCVLRALRADKVVPAVQDFIAHTMGARYIEPPPFDLAAAFSDSTNMTPLIFVLSPGADPTAELLKLADAMGFGKKLGAISLGQGQGRIAEAMIKEATAKGSWLLLQNCHLAVSWMPELERITEGMTSAPERVHRDFRLWLTSMPSEQFPVSILQNGVKMTNEPPKGLKANLQRSYLSIDKDFFAACKKQKAWKKMLFALCFFHAVVQERRKFGALGWNIPYEFNETDYKISSRQLQMFLDAYPFIPYKALTYLTGQANYGGRVTDDWDRRLLMALLSDFYCEAIHDDAYKFSPSRTYYAPADGPYESYLTYIRALPIRDSPEVFGLHDNADITYALNETGELLGNALSLQPRTTGGGGKTMDAVVDDLCGDILERLPQPFDVMAVQEKFPVQYEESMNTVLTQDVLRFNKLIVVVRNSLAELRKAIKGLVVMSADLEKVANAMYDGLVPVMWAGVAYPSLKPLASWVQDLIARLDFMQKWIDTGMPPVYWLSGFFFPQAFLTGTLQNYARRHKIPIDMIHFEFEVLGAGERPGQGPADGCYVNGLFLEGARWDDERRLLAESHPKVLYVPMPVIWLRPTSTAGGGHTHGGHHKERLVYTCPLYKTSRRAGTLSTTGHSTNYVMSVLLPSEQPEKHWVKRGVALLCQLND
eukprot:tig00001206_g7515.t1